MNDQDYKFILDLYDTKNITKVAQQGYMSQPALTKRIRRIEMELGCQLLLRSKKGVVFTDAGELVVNYCRQILGLKSALHNSINQLKGVVGGTLQIGSSLNYSRYRLSSALHKYQTLYPMVDVQVITGRSITLHRMLMEKKLSLAIIRGNYPWDEGSILLSSEPICLVRSYENVDRPLSEYTYISHRTDLDEEKRIEQWMMDNSIVPSKHFQVDDLATCREMAQAGVGWTIIPSICLDNFRGDVVPLRCADHALFLRNTYVLYRYTHYELRQVKLFLEILAQNDATFPSHLDGAVKGHI